VSVVVVAYLFPHVCLIKGIQHYFTAGQT